MVLTVSDVLKGAGISNPRTQLQINGILNIVNLVSAFAACFFVDKIGRRRLFLGSTTGMLLAFSSWTVCAAQFVKTAVPAAANAEIAFIFIFYTCYNVAWSGPLVSYGVEILPYRIRAKVGNLLDHVCDLC